MKEAWINDIEGIGQADIFESRGLKECRGVFVPSDPGKAMVAAQEDGARFKGVVVENGIETVCDFPIIISKSTMDSSGSRIEFVATGNPYEGREKN